MPSMPPVQPRHTFSIGYFVLVALALVWVQSLLSPQAKQIPYSEFKTLVEQGQVEKVLISDTLIRGAPARRVGKRFEELRHRPGN